MTGVPAAAGRARTPGMSARLVKKSPDPLRVYLILMRLHAPTGVLLYLLPGLWSLSLATEGRPDLSAVVLLALAAVLVRGASCAVNDVIDKDIDAQVARTASRPVVTGAISVGNALLFAVAQAVASLALLALVNVETALVVGASYPLLVAYPYMKRVFPWPTAWLALVINVYALAGWTAVTGSMDYPPSVLGLYACGFFWTLFHDTVYSHQDKEYDRSIGVKSSALMFGDSSKAWLGVFIALSVAGALWAGAEAGTGWAFYPLVVGAGLLLSYLVVRVNLDDPKSCWDAFVANRSFGWIILAATVAGQFT
ncbi:MULTISPECIES: 4-hydroxybenzoate octaprenyltransferase [unclassified Streptomyces]|uniref:4-hydroxybenzoate octaprenyltransferase n=1 Tax=unclassified Streptomyces TaxID=2593676 RepID=UPI002E78D544|nr:4-hydroxybenzoate octaprenyltransferase [Streptomyces sp. JV176]MEE1804338.1 4-hydroxybenzoate octaprenyltransferase [Streptomyces sp. JV176]